MLQGFGEDSDVTDILLFCHSTGNVIAYEALAKLHQSNSPLAQQTLGKVKALIGTGSILGMAWNPSIVKHSRFKKPIPTHIHWYNLWTQYDIGAAGPIVAENKPWLATASLRNRRVNNVEDIAMDHTGYLDNDEQVISLVLEELGGLNDNNDFWRGRAESDASGWKQRSEQAWKDFNVRRGTVAWLAIWRLPIWFVLPVMFPLMSFHYGWAQGVGSFFQLQQIPWFWLNWFTTGLTTSDPSIITRVGMAVLISTILTAGATGLYYIYKYLWWIHWAGDVRLRRHEEFKAWRARGAEPTQAETTG